MTRKISFYQSTGTAEYTNSISAEGVGLHQQIAQSVGAAEYIDCILDEG